MRVLYIAGLFLIAATLVSAGSAPATSAIGFVRSSGDFSLDGSQTRDNATVFDGAVLETTISPSHTTLRDGTRVDLGTDSRERVFRDHALLERGTTQVHGGAHYAVFASHLRISSTEPFRVAFTAPGAVRVSALDGFTEVKNAQGQLVAMVMPGSPLEFQDAGASAPTRVTGCLQKVGSRYVLRDETTNTVMELTGPDLEKYAGKQIVATGSNDPNGTPLEGAAQVIRVASVTAGSGQGCRVNIASAALAGTAGTAAAGAAAGMSLGVKAAIIAGVAAAGTVGGLAASGAFTGGAAPATSTGAAP